MNGGAPGREASSASSRTVTATGTQIGGAEPASRRGRRHCPLCDRERIGDEAYAELFTLYGSVGARRLRREGAALVAARVDLLGGPVSPEVIWAHFAQHDRRQPRPPGNLKRAKTLAATDGLSERQREVLRMVGRLGSICAQHIWQSLYEDQLRGVNAARSVCYRDLHTLIYGHWLYRARAPRSRGLMVREEERIDTLTFLHPGRQLIPLFERDEGFVPPIITDAGQVSEHELRLVHAANAIVVDLRRELYGGLGLGERVDVRINPANWFGTRQAGFSFANPARGVSERVSPDGLAAVSVIAPERGLDLTLPFFYVNDTGLVSVEALVEQLVAYGSLRITAAAAERFPELAGCTPALLLVCDDARRLQAVAGATARRLSRLAPIERTLALVSDRTSIRGRAFTSPVWAPLEQAERPEGRVNLLRGLLEMIGAGAREAGLRSSSVLSWRAP